MNKTTLIITILLLVATVTFAQEKKEKTVGTTYNVTDASAAFFNGLGYKMDKEQEEKYLSNLSPEVVNYLNLIKKYDEKRYYSLLYKSRFKASGGLFAFQSGSKNDSDDKMWKLELESEALGLEFQNTQGDKSAIESKLYKNLAELFRLREEQRRSEVSQLETELRELKAALEFRIQNKEEIIQRRMIELTGKGKYLDWD